MKPILILHPKDTVGVALRDLQAGPVDVDGTALELLQPVPQGHKVALKHHESEEQVYKFGHLIGHAITTIRAGEWVHTHNVMSNNGSMDQYKYEPNLKIVPRPASGGSFQGYRRKGKRVGTRNEIWIVPTVACVNGIAQRLAEMGCASLLGGGLEGVYAFPHPFGCSQLGGDLARTAATLEGLVRHPNAGGVLILGLGCENLRLQPFTEGLWGHDAARVRSLEVQSVENEMEVAFALLEELAGLARQDKRETCPASDLVIGMNCGGSDSFSGVTANPVVGRITDRVCGLGGRVLLTEVPEMYGAEQILMNRAHTRNTFMDIVQLLQDFKDYFQRHGQPLYDNPMPGNKDGGISTLEEKSLGAVQKGGQAAVCGVLNYGDPVVAKGLSLLGGPGNDGVSSTALVVSGATLLLFTTGRGTPIGFPVPTLKIASNGELARKKRSWIDFDASIALEQGIDAAAETLYELVLKVASGQQVCNELNNQREIAVWKDGVTL